MGTPFATNARPHRSATAITTVSRFFSDKHPGAVTERPPSAPEDSTARKQRSLLQRLHIHTSIKRGKSPTPLRPPTAPAAVGSGSSSLTAVRSSPSESDAATIEEITRIMPQSLLISSQSQGSSAKRQRSTGDSSARVSADSVDQNGASEVPLASSLASLKPDVKMPPYLDKTKTEILATFQELEWKQRFRLFHAMEHPDDSPYRVDRSEVVVSRNRYGNVQPWDASRIKLKAPINGSDYVNASPIVLKSRTTPESKESISTGPSSEVKYIATQGPKSGQASHFWHMVHQELTGDTGVIIMLTQLIEDSKEKCAQYYPASLEEPTITLKHEDATQGPGNVVSSQEASEMSEPSSSDMSEPSSTSEDTLTLLTKDFDESVACEVRKMTLTINEQPKTIIHYLFPRWPDFGKPDAHDRKALIELSRRSYIESAGSPRVVHCSAGVGRTGTWIALDFLVREVEEERLLDTMRTPTRENRDPSTSSDTQSGDRGTWGKSGPPKANTPTQEDGFDKDEHDLIFETVNNLREQRMMMVIREVQYSFLYDVVREALFEKYTARPTGAVVKVTSDLELRGRPSKSRRVSEEVLGAETTSEAETEIVEDDTVKGSEDEDEDPYSAVSPDVVRRGLSQEFS